MRSFYFVRHGQTDWNALGRMQGQSDVPLNATGLEQAKKAAQLFANFKIDRVISSPLQRAAVTAQIICDALHTPLTFDDRLMERNFGVIEGMLQSEIRQADPRVIFSADTTLDWQGFRLPKNAETIDQVGIRGLAAIKQAQETYPNAMLLFVAHGSWFRAIAHDLTGGEIINSDNAVPYFCQATTPYWHIEQAPVI